MSKKTWKLNPSRKREGWHALIGPYDGAFVRDLKASVDRRDRDWNEVGTFWLIRDTAVEVAQRVIDDHYKMQGAA